MYPSTGRNADQTTNVGEDPHDAFVEKLTKLYIIGMPSAEVQIVGFFVIFRNLNAHGKPRVVLRFSSGSLFFQRLGAKQVTLRSLERNNVFITKVY